MSVYGTESLISNFCNNKFPTDSLHTRLKEFLISFFPSCCKRPYHLQSRTLLNSIFFFFFFFLFFRPSRVKKYSNSGGKHFIDRAYIRTFFFFFFIFSGRSKMSRACGYVERIFAVLRAYESTLVLKKKV